MHTITTVFYYQDGKILIYTRSNDGVDESVKDQTISVITDSNINVPFGKQKEINKTITAMPMIITITASVLIVMIIALCQ